MIISGKQVQSILKVYNEQKSLGKQAKADNANELNKKDEVILSSSAQEFGHILQGLKTMNEVRPERVQELARQIDMGTYRVDARAVADKMIGRMLADQD